MLLQPQQGPGSIEIVQLEKAHLHGAQLHRDRLSDPPAGTELAGRAQGAEHQGDGSRGSRRCATDEACS